MKTEQLEKVLENARAWILAVDQKTNIVFVLELALITLISKPSYELIVLVKGELSIVSLISLTAAAVLFALSLLKLMLAIKPRVKAAGVDSLIFFGFIAQRTLNAYRKDVSKTNARSYKADLVTQIHTTAIISANKHKNYSDGMFALLAAMLAWICFLVSVGWVYYGNIS